MPRKPQRNPILPEARDAFIAYVHEWQGKLGLGDWRITVSDQSAAREAAYVRADYEARLAAMRLGTDLGSTVVTAEAMEALAVHELLHVLLKELVVLCQDPKTQEDVINSAEHRVINTLQRLLVPTTL